MLCFRNYPQLFFISILKILKRSLLTNIFSWNIINLGNIQNSCSKEAYINKGQTNRRIPRLFHLSLQPQGALLHQKPKRPAFADIPAMPDLFLFENNYWLSVGRSYATHLLFRLIVSYRLLLACGYNVDAIINVPKQISFII